MSQPIKLEEHHPELMKMDPDTRRIINAYQNGGWWGVDREIQDIVTEAFHAGRLSERCSK